MSCGEDNDQEGSGTSSLNSPDHGLKTSCVKGGTHPKHFFDYLLEQRRVTGNPVKPSHMVRRGRPLPKALSLDQVRQLFAQIHHPMDKALFLLMLRCGLRVSEVVHLTLDDIDWSQQAIRIDQGVVL